MGVERLLKRNDIMYRGERNIGLKGQRQMCMYMEVPATMKQMGEKNQK